MSVMSLPSDNFTRFRVFAVDVAARFRTVVTFHLLALCSAMLSWPTTEECVLPQIGRDAIEVRQNLAVRMHHPVFTAFPKFSELYIGFCIPVRVPAYISPML